ncbi:MAG: membrane dipeptidase [Gemmatimonadales bacterium]|nr:membrane dipeptidase [Gemmatimonadales bacterium]
MTTRRAFLCAVGASTAGPWILRGRFTRFGGQSYSVRCLDLMRQALVIDMLSPLTIRRSTWAAWARQPESLSAEVAARYRASGISVFHTAVGWGGPDAYLDALKYFLSHNALIAGREDLFLRIDSAGDLARVKATGKTGILLGAQNSDHFIKPGLDPRDLLATVDEFYGYGQRVSQLTYNTLTWFGSGATDRGDPGLSELGVQLVARMNKVGMAIDTSHCGDRTTLDAFEVSTKPVLVTHSNVRNLAAGHPRCKPDEVIRAVGKAGSVFGVTGVRNFVTDREPTTIEHFLDHIDYIARMIGVEHVGIGSDIDLDGYDDLSPAEQAATKASYDSSYRFREKLDIDEIAHPKRMFDVTEGLIRRGYTNGQILGILGANFQRVLGQIWI